MKEKTLLAVCRQLDYLDARNVALMCPTTYLCYQALLPTYYMLKLHQWWPLRIQKLLEQWQECKLGWLLKNQGKVNLLNMHVFAPLCMDKHYTMYAATTYFTKVFEKIVLRDLYRIWWVIIIFIRFHFVRCQILRMYLNILIFKHTKTFSKEIIFQIFCFPFLQLFLYKLARVC